MTYGVKNARTLLVQILDQTNIQEKRKIKQLRGLVAIRVTSTLAKFQRL
jgi:hypothetical protein